jgi:uncharacterized protein YcfJ
MKELLLMSACSFMLFSCSTFRPILDENDKYLKVGSARAEKDIDICLQKADAYLEQHKGERMSKEVGRGAATGAIMGTVVGGLSGQSLSSAAGGAVVGAGVGAGGAYVGEKGKDKWTPDELKQRYVTNCLKRQKYEVIGWK